MLRWTEEELRAMREADAEIDAQGDLFPGVNRDVAHAVDSKNSRREYQRAYYRKNREKIRARQNADPEARRVYNQEYYRKNRERIREQARIRWKTDPEYRAANARRTKEYYRRKKKGV